MQASAVIVPSGNQLEYSVPKHLLNLLKIEPCVFIVSLTDYVIKL